MQRPSLFGQKSPRIIKTSKSMYTEQMNHAVFINPSRLWVYRSGYFVNVNSEKVLDVKGNKIEKNGRMAARE